jgi:replicative DNA helicase
MAKIDEIFLDKAKDLAQIVPSSNISKFSQMQSRIDSYRERKEQGIQIGIPFGIPKLDELTLGLQSHQYVTIAGFTGVGKSTLGMVLSVHHYLEGANPMIISLEMDEEEIYRKLDAIAVGIKQHAIKEMTLSPNEMKKWEKWADRAEKAANDIIVVDVDFATPEKVYAETARWNPDVVVVDYVQLMSAPNHFKQTWEKVGYVSQMLKMQARQLRIPVYGIAQTNAEGMTEGANLGNLGGSKDIGKHSDIVIGLKQDETMYEMDRMDINVVKNRAGPKGHFSMLWDQANAIFRPWMGEDAYRKKEIA